MWDAIGAAKSKELIASEYNVSYLDGAAVRIPVPDIDDRVFVLGGRHKMCAFAARTRETAFTPILKLDRETPLFGEFDRVRMKW